MRVLKKGSSGLEVKTLQKRLKGLGFNPGNPDGVFGAATRAAVISFQKSNGLVADGIAGPKTRAALGLEPDRDTSSVIPSVKVTVVSRMFPVTPPGNIKANLPLVLTALEKARLTDKDMVLTALATIRAEAECFEPVSELISRFNTSPAGRPFDLYDYRRELGNKGPPDGERYRGRGFVQLTGRSNYQHYGEELGLGSRLLDNSELANEEKLAAELLACFIKDRETQIREALRDRDLKTARRLVNGGIYGLERFTDAFRIGEKLIV